MVRVCGVDDLVEKTINSPTAVLSSVQSRDLDVDATTATEFVVDCGAFADGFRTLEVGT